MNEKLMEKYLPGYKATGNEINEANKAVKIQKIHVDWLLNLLASTLETIKASDVNKKAAIEVFANGLEGTNSNFNRERFVRTAYQKILKDEVVSTVTPPEEEMPPMREEETLDEKKKRKMDLKKCINKDCGAMMPKFFNECPKCGTKQNAPEEGEKEVKKEGKK